jgi:hypothetical protein
METITKARLVSEPYSGDMSLREYARDFLCKYQDGDFRAKFGMPDMPIAELVILGQAAGWK